jgi:hypothetical protein
MGVALKPAAAFFDLINNARVALCATHHVASRCLSPSETGVGYRWAGRCYL